MRWLFDRLWQPSIRHPWLRPFVLWLARRTGRSVPMSTRYKTLAQLKRAARKVKIPQDPVAQRKRWAELDRTFHLLNDNEMAEHYALNLALGNQRYLRR